MKRSISDVAESILAQTGVLLTDEGFPIIEMFRWFGITVFQKKLSPSNTLSYLAVSTEYRKFTGCNKFVCVDVEKSFGRKRFLLAMELAHYLTKYSGEGSYFHVTYEENNDEWVKEFARSLLMPEQLFREKWKTSWGRTESLVDTVTAVSKQFGVEYLEVIERARSIDILGKEVGVYTPTFLV